MADVIALSQMRTRHARRAEMWADRVHAALVAVVCIAGATVIWSMLDLFLYESIIGAGEFGRIVILGIAFGFGFYAKARMGSVEP